MKGLVKNDHAVIIIVVQKSWLGMSARLEGACVGNRQQSPTTF